MTQSWGTTHTSRREPRVRRFTIDRAGSGQYDTSRVVRAGRAAAPWPLLLSSEPPAAAGDGSPSNGSSECGPRYPQQVSSSVSSPGQAA